MKLPESNGLTLIETSVVLLVLSILIAFLSSLLSSFPIFRSAENEAVILRNAFMFSSTAAVKSNRPVFFELDLEKEEYRAFRRITVEGVAEERNILNTRVLSASNSLVDVYLPSGGRLTEGKLVIPFSPDGTVEDLSVHMGPDPVIDYTVLLSRYGMEAQVVNGDVIQNLDNPDWHENVEELE